MLRTNQIFLSYFEKLYHQQDREIDILLKSYPKGEKILVQGQFLLKPMIIKEGVTKCFFTEENGKEYIVEFSGSGEIIGEIEMIKNTPCLCSIETLSEVSVYEVTVPYFRFLLKNDIILNNLLLDTFAERIINTSSRASYQQLYTTEHTLTQLLKMQAKEGIQISKEDMAAYLGITVRSLNRILKDLK
ncbi:Crp/Fnr family transcriptional regulator [Chryseobacterium sp.]|uniref:Crp/Fnr family transcriptional regulator n=1 Tax=Chryseobacterium sp. TaxID=1871047 RepID=UPI001B2AF7AE|nr:Crp/Fnr family transcriptional regulator [Chryseobacterium sp.]MBO9691519.1 Crp/Fnr family transcriptional regulator [Chryseobacterium sp.]